ncbi:NlpC/P60 family protein, partial [Clostridioides difficile]
GTYVTHVAIYVGNNQMYHAGNPIGYADLNSSYWQQHLIGAGREWQMLGSVILCLCRSR